MTTSIDSAAVAAAFAVLMDHGVDVERDVALAPFTTYRLGGPADVLVRATTVDDLRGVAAAVRRSALPVLAIGRGSNLLVSDQGFRGIAVLISGLGGEIDAPHAPLDGSTAASVRAGAGVALPVLARRLAGGGWRGFEWAVGVPGSVGGAVRMNAGGHGSDMAACLEGATVFDLSTGSLDERNVEALGLGFRSSALSADEVVVDATLHVERGDRAEAEAALAEIVRWRREHQPGGHNAGSVFVNPEPGEVSAGALIDGLGLRGLRFGTAEVSTKHANFIQSSEGGSAEDVRALIELVRERVAEATGYVLRSEVRLVGFDAAEVGAADRDHPDTPGPDDEGALS